MAATPPASPVTCASNARLSKFDQDGVINLAPLMKFPLNLHTMGLSVFWGHSKLLNSRNREQNVTEALTSKIKPTRCLDNLQINK